MPKVERDIVVEAPLSAVYNQWTQFEQFPQFMEGVEEVRQLDDRHLIWRVELAGRMDEWEAEIEEQTPDERISWRSTAGRDVGGEVTFKPAGEGRTNVHLDMDYDLETWAEEVGDVLGFVERRVEGDLDRFKEFIESRGGHETGAWRGSIHDGRSSGPDSAGEREREPKMGTKSHVDAERDMAEARQQEPGGGAPGGQAAIDPMTGQIRNP